MAGSSGYNLVNLSDMLEQLGEQRVEAILSPFSCSHNKDVEQFLHNKAILFAKQGIARTFLLFASHRNEMQLIGYFTLANKVLTVDPSVLSSNDRRRINRFGEYNSAIKKYQISAPLIGQLGKNFSNGYNTLVTGDELLKMACDKAREAQMIIGGRIIYLECEDTPNLIGFYNRNGFRNLGKRPLDKDERTLMTGEYLLQMLRYQK